MKLTRPLLSFLSRYEKLMVNLDSRIFVGRPLWMNGVFAFCAYMTFIYLPWDVFVKPIAEDEEVWFGVLFYGWMAKIGGVIHWFVYATITYGLWDMRPWVRLWISIYLLQIAFSMIVWAYLTEASTSPWLNLLIGAVFVMLSYMFYRSQSVFET